MALRPYIEKLLNREHLQESESLEAMQQIMDGAARDIEIAAFLVALRSKGEAPQELAGFVKCMKTKALMIKSKMEPVVDTCGTGGDKANTFNISTTAAFIASGAGAFVAKHGNRGVTSRCGSADVLEALGAQITLTPDQAANVLDEVGITFFFAPNFHPAMKNVAAVRKALGIRTVFNLLGPLANPANARHHLLGVYSEELCAKIAETLRILGSERAYVVYNSEGMDELGLKGENTIAVLQGGKVEMTTMKAKDLGMTEKGVREFAGSDPAANAQTLRFVLEGKDKGPKRAVCVLNAAYALMAAGIASTPQEGIEKANQSIDSGKAAEKLEKFIEATKAATA